MAKDRLDWWRKRALQFTAAVLCTLLTGELAIAQRGGRPAAVSRPPPIPRMESIRPPSSGLPQGVRIPAEGLPHLPGKLPYELPPGHSLERYPGDLSSIPPEYWPSANDGVPSEVRGRLRSHEEILRDYMRTSDEGKKSELLREYLRTRGYGVSSEPPRPEPAAPARESDVPPKSPLDWFSKYAEAVIGEPVGPTNDERVLVSKQGDDLFVCSNRYGEQPSKLRIAVAGSRLCEFLPERQKAQFVLDQNLFNRDGTCYFDLEGLSKPCVVLGNNSTPMELIRLHPARGPPLKWAVEWRPHIFVKVTNEARPERLFESLRSTHFSKNNLTLISLFRLKSVEDALAASSLSQYQSKLSEFSESALMSALEQHPNKTIALLGHVEHGRFVTRSRDNTEILIDVPIATIERVAARIGSNILYLGCNAGVDATLGARTEFKPISAIDRLARSLDATNVAELLERYCTETLSLVLDASAFDRTQPKVEFVRARLKNDFTRFDPVKSLHVDDLEATRGAESSNGEDSGKARDVNVVGFIKSSGWDYMNSSPPTGWQAPSDSSDDSFTMPWWPWIVMLLVCGLFLYVIAQRK